jgi:hypothetical protein
MAPLNLGFYADDLFGDLLNASEMSKAAFAAAMLLHDLRIFQVHHFTAVPAPLWFHHAVPSVPFYVHPPRTLTPPRRSKALLGLLFRATVPEVCPVFAPFIELPPVRTVRTAVMAGCLAAKR